MDIQEIRDSIGRREIEFRAWQCDAKKMVYQKKHYAPQYDDLNFVKMQYTEIKDKNGQKIFEGDLVKINRGKDSCIVLIYFRNSTIGSGYEGQYSDLNGHIKKGAWDQKLVSGKSNLAMYNDNSEVIGNIFENKDLLFLKK